jgi:diguanylate cyclase (GGDEF)-like protein
VAALENSRLYARTQDLASHDELTGLHTKGYFLERVARECRRAGRRQGVFSLLLADIDNFKAYNDRFGHAAGDILLKAVSRIIRDFFKESGALTGRFGGEEFCILLDGADKHAAFGLAQRLREKISQEKVILRRQETAVTVSVGVAGFPADAAEADELIQKADRAMYQAKEKGRNRVCLA